MNEEVRFWIQQIQEGNLEDAFFGLLEIKPPPTAELIGIFHESTDRDVRRYLAWIIRSRNDPTAISFFEEVIYDPDPEIWKEGMDGLVCIASQRALEILKTALNRHFDNQKETLQFREWLEEAIEQTEETILQPQERPKSSH